MADDNIENFNKPSNNNFNLNYLCFSYMSGKFPMNYKISK